MSKKSIKGSNKFLSNPALKKITLLFNKNSPQLFRSYRKKGSINNQKYKQKRNKSYQLTIYLYRITLKRIVWRERIQKNGYRNNKNTSLTLFCLKGRMKYSMNRITGLRQRLNLSGSWVCAVRSDRLIGKNDQGQSI